MSRFSVSRVSSALYIQLVQSDLESIEVFPQCKRDYNTTGGLKEAARSFSSSISVNSLPGACYFPMASVRVMLLTTKRKGRKVVVVVGRRRQRVITKTPTPTPFHRFDLNVDAIRCGIGCVRSAARGANAIRTT